MRTLLGLPFDLIQQGHERTAQASRSNEGVTDGFKRAAMLQGQRGYDRSVLSNRLSGGPGLGTVYEDLGDPAVVEPTDAASIKLTSGFEPVQPM
jgi:hypothetical protein